MEKTREANDIFSDIEALPHGDLEGDHVLLDRYTVETLKLCREFMDSEGTYFNDLHNLIDAAIKKWEELREEFYYA